MLLNIRFLTVTKIHYVCKSSFPALLLTFFAFIFLLGCTYNQISSELPFYHCANENISSLALDHGSRCCWSPQFGVYSVIFGFTFFAAFFPSFFSWVFFFPIKFTHITIVLLTCDTCSRQAFDVWRATKIPTNQKWIQSHRSFCFISLTFWIFSHLFTFNSKSTVSLASCWSIKVTHFLLDKKKKLRSRGKEALSLLSESFLVISLNLWFVRVYEVHAVFWEGSNRSDNLPRIIGRCHRC